MTEQDKLQESTENHRFYLAVLFIFGFLFIMFFALLGEFLGLYTGLKDLVAVFSGWITAVIGFYFLQQNTEKAQQQTREVMSHITPRFMEMKTRIDVQQEEIEKLRKENNELRSKLKSKS